MFCVNTSETDGRAGPFMLYAKAVDTPTGSATKPLYRCSVPLTSSSSGETANASQHYSFSTDASCADVTGKMVVQKRL